MNIPIIQGAKPVFAIGNRERNAIPKKCGDCNFCSDPIPLQVEKVGVHIAFRCMHPHPMAKDWKGRRTGVDPDEAPEQMFCPLLNGIGAGFDLLRPKLSAHQLALDIHNGTNAAKNAPASQVEARIGQAQQIGQGEVIAESIATKIG